MTPKSALFDALEPKNRDLGLKAAEGSSHLEGLGLWLAFLADRFPAYFPNVNGRSVSRLQSLWNSALIAFGSKRQTSAVVLQSLRHL